jgi:hypothetical protein
MRSDRAQRDKQYRAAGMFIAQHCHVLIALWDGDEQHMTIGNAAEIVAFKKQGIPLELSGSAQAHFDLSTIGPVIHVITPRAAAGSLAIEVQVARWGRAVDRQRMERSFMGLLFGGIADRSFLPAREQEEVTLWRKFASLSAITRRFNGDAAQWSGTVDGQAVMDQCLDYLFHEHPGGMNEEAARRALARAPRWCGLYAVAEGLAIKQAHQFRRDLQLLFSLVLAALLCFEAFSYLAPAENWLLATYSIALLAALILFVLARRRGRQQRFLDYRALSEALRIGIYWKLAGIGSGGLGRRGSAMAVGQLYPVNESSELAWVKICLNSLDLLDSIQASPETSGMDQSGHGWLRKLWVSGQVYFFRHQAFRLSRLADKHEARSILLLALSAIVIAPLMLLLDFLFSGAGSADWYASTYRHLFIFLVALLPSLAVVSLGYSSQLSLRTQSRQYERMRQLFERAYQSLPERIDDTVVPAVQALYVQLGAEAMKEMAAWMAIFRHPTRRRAAL